MTVRHAAEHGIYVLESDGYLLDRFKTFYNDEYGVLTFVEDHGLMQNCEAAGSGDSGLYPGAGAEGGHAAPARAPRSATRRRSASATCHHNASGYSGTARNSVHVHHNNFYDNALGFTTDVFTAAGHPGFPQDSDLVENNNFYSNNFNPYAAGLRRRADGSVPGRDRDVDRGRQRQHRAQQPLLGQLAARHDAVRGSRRDRLQRPRRTRSPAAAPAETSTSINNRFHDNVMGVAPNGSPQPERHRLLVGQLPRQHRQLLVREHARPRQVDHHLAPAAAAAELQQRPQPRLERRHRRRRPANEAELLSCLAGFRQPRAMTRDLPLVQDPAEADAVALGDEP